MNERNQIVLTIGHSTHSVERFIALLRSNTVAMVADVRSIPFSHYNPQFNEGPLKATLQSNGIRYVLFGRELGGRTDDSSCYENGRVRYDKLAQTGVFKTGLDQIIRASRKHRIALMCAEKEPLECHRTLLVARALAEKGVEVAHILADGSLEAHCTSMGRLLSVVGLPEMDLFLTREQLIEEALARQEHRVAYTDKGSTSEAYGQL